MTNTEASDIDSYIRCWRKRLNARLTVLVPPPHDPLRRVQGAMNYAVQAGHRWRPLLLISIYEETTGNDGLAVIDAACAVEIIHSCTIVLDDLPFVDNNASIRRGAVPCHVVYGPAEVVYASHLLYALAERLSIENALRLGVDENGVRWQTTKAREDLIDAQIIEINLQKHSIPISKTSLGTLYELKSRLFTLAASLATTLGKVENNQRNALLRFAKSVGIAYQLKDDILDLEGTASEMGKPTGMDNGKVTMLSELGLHYSLGLIRKELFEAEQLLNFAIRNSSLVRGLIRRIVDHEALARTRLSP